MWHSLSCLSGFASLPFTFTFAFALASAFVSVFANVVETSIGSDSFRSLLASFANNPALVRVQVRLADCSKFVVVTLELLGIHRKLSRSFHGASRNTTLIFTSSSSFDAARFPRTLLVCHPFLAATQLATVGVFDPRCPLPRFPPPTDPKLRTRFCLALGVPVLNFVVWSVSPTRCTVCGATFG